MARVVQQRRSPPYLLIVAVFLFLVATALAFLQYMQADDAKEANVKLSSDMNRLANRQELREIQQMLERYNRPPAGKARKTVVGQFLEHQKGLTMLIAGIETDAEDAAVTRAKALEEGRGLIAQLIDARKQLAEQRKRSNELSGQNSGLLEEIDEKDKLARELITDFEEKISQLNEQVHQLDQKFQEFQKNHEQQLAGAKEEWDRLRAELDRNIASKTQRIQEQLATQRGLEMTVNKLRTQLRRSTQSQTEPTTIARQYDGKVIKVLDQQNICYINLGTKDRVRAGLTFGVYPPSGIPESGKGKGSILVTNAGQSVSECRIVQQDMQDPITDNDLIANLAFDVLRNYIFVVEGEFDLRATDRPSKLGTKEVKMLIKQCGGRIAEELSIETDFVVMGSKPFPPPKPSETAPAAVWRSWQEQMKVHDRYRNVETLAQNMHIPVLNTNRFLAFMGYSPGR